VGNLDQSGITLDSSGDVSQAGPVNHEVGELDLNGMSLDTSGNESLEAEDVAPLSESNRCIIPNQSSVADVPDVVSEPFLKQLPQRHTRGIPKPTYEPELSSKIKYPMSHYVYNHRLSESNMSFVNQLSIVSIPNSVQEALVDPRWKAVLNEEMKSLQKK